MRIPITKGAVALGLFIALLCTAVYAQEPTGQGTKVLTLEASLNLRSISE